MRRYSCQIDAEPFSDSVFSLSALEAKLVSYVNDPEAAEKPFDASSIPKVSRQQAAQEAARTSSIIFVELPLIPVMCRSKYPGHHWCSHHKEIIPDASTTVCRGDPIGLRPTARGSSGTGVIWSRSSQQCEAGAAHGERNGVPGFVRQTHLQGACRFPGMLHPISVHV